jgi:ATP-dependent RNA helicase RhlB
LADESKTPGSAHFETGQRADKPDFLTQTRFDEFDLPAKVISNLNDAGFLFCTPIQAQTLPVSLAGRDVAGQAQTGTGKTAAFLVTIFTRFFANEAQILFRNTDFRIIQVVGGIDYRRQADSLRQGADIIICTPGRIIDYYKQGNPDSCY